MEEKFIRKDPDSKSFEVYTAENGRYYVRDYVYVEKYCDCIGGKRTRISKAEYERMKAYVNERSNNNV